MLLFFGTAAHPDAARAIAKALDHEALFDDERAAFFGISIDPADVREDRIRPRNSGVRFFLDPDREISRLFGSVPAGKEGKYLAHWLLLDRTLRVEGRFPINEGDAAMAALEASIAAAPDPDWAPVVAVPNVFEPGLCRHLIALHQQQKGEPTGFMREVDGMTRLIVDRTKKIRRDHEIADQDLIVQLHLRIRRRLMPMIQRAFQFDATHIERALIGCYEAEEGGHFRAHRDNTTRGTAHRRFAVSINLNAEDYEGGDLIFPEFGPRTYRAPTGGAIVFSCSLLHQVMPVTKGERYAFLPFLYDEAGAKIYAENRKFVDTAST